VDVRYRAAVINSCVLEGKQIGRVLADCDFWSVICELYSRTNRSCTCVRILEELWTVIKSCVLNCECTKVPSWSRTCEFVTICKVVYSVQRHRNISWKSMCYNKMCLPSPQLDKRMGWWQWLGSLQCDAASARYWRKSSYGPRTY
jgi:hypothetical protein